MRKDYQLRIDGSGIVNLAGGICWGDNVVFQADNRESYGVIASTIISDLGDFKGNIHYINYYKGDFALNIANNGAKLFAVDPSKGFERFVDYCCWYIDSLPAGEDNIIFLDCLTSLVSYWGSDWICGYAYKILAERMRSKHITSFVSMLNACHRKAALKLATDVSSISIRVMKDNVGRHCLMPRKVEGRRSTIMYKPYILEEEKGTRPIESSHEAVELTSQPARDGDSGYYSCLDNMFLSKDADERDVISKLCSLMMGNDARILELASRYFTLDDLKAVQRRTVGSGCVGGKAAGMLIARKILKHEHKNKYKEFVEPDDSFYLGSDVFYAYIINNGLWEEYKNYINSPDIMKGKRLRRKVLNGTMPVEIKDRLEGLIDHFGHYPIIVRSSSLLEDSFESSFAGKYESHFCILTGEDSHMVQELSETIKCVFASMFDPEATKYRQNTDLHGQSDIMSIIIQRVSGVYQGDYYFPHIAGVGHSYNSYIWDRKIDPSSGLLRLVAGLGTRAVGNHADDYARMIALNRPNDFPMPGIENRRLFTQKYIDVININMNSFDVIKVGDVDFSVFAPSHKIIADRDIEIERKIYKATGDAVNAWYINHDYIINHTTVLQSMGDIMQTLERAYGHPVEIEFAVNFRDKENYRINILQCRPVQVQKVSGEVAERSTHEYNVMYANGTFMGGSISMIIDTVVYVHWDEYMKLEPEKKRHCAEIVGLLNQRVKDKGLNCMLMGYGRWGSSVTALGIPVEFSDINGMKAVVEIAKQERGMVAELSYGTHFFHDIVESKIAYISVMDDGDNFFIDDSLTKRHNMIKKALEEPEGFEKVIGYFRFPKRPLRVITDIKTQKMSIYRKKRN